MLLRRQHCSAERRAQAAITIQIYTRKPLNSIPGADPLLFSLDYARPEPPAAENTNTHLKSGRSHCFGFTCLRKQACRQLWTTVDNCGQPYRRVSSDGISRIQSLRQRPVNRAQRPGNRLDVSFPAPRPCDIMEGKGGAIRHVTYAPPPGTFIPASPLVYSSTQIKVPVDSRT